MNVTELLALIPEEELAFLSSETKVDHQVKKLDGITMFKLLLFSLLHHDKASLRVMESLYTSMQFKMIADTEGKTTKFNSIRDRISSMNPKFFEKIFYLVFDRFSNLLNEQESLLRFDSTMVAISSKLIQYGMKLGRQTDKVQLKYTIATKGSFPCHVKLFDQPKELSEDIALSETILSNEISKTGIVVFDRGISSRKVYKELTDSDIVFVTRINTNVAYKEVTKLPFKQCQTSDTVTITEVKSVKLKNKKNVWSNIEYRLIKAVRKENNAPIYFLTNNFELEPAEICRIYRQRWDIEVFFKFLKQHLNLSHLVTRNRNGIMVMLYMTLILAILLIAFKKLNKIESYKISKLRFGQELETEIVKQIVILSGGNPSKLPHLFNDS